MKTQRLSIKFRLNYCNSNSEMFIVFRLPDGGGNDICSNSQIAQETFM
jgi:hypothetical protein